MRILQLLSAFSLAATSTVPRNGTRMLRNVFLLALWVITTAAPALAQVTFDVSFDASADVLTATERNNVTSHIGEAGKRWVGFLSIVGARSIAVRVFVDNSIPTSNGASVVSSDVGVIGGRDTYEQGVAYELLTGVDPNGTDADANIKFNLAYLRNELWFDPDPAARTAPVPTDRTDAMSVVLHELGHVLAYNGWADLNTGQPPATYWSVFDRWMTPGQPTLFSGPAAMAAWGTWPNLTVGNIFHWGNAARGTYVEDAARCAAQPTLWVRGAPVPQVCNAPESADAPPSMDVDTSLPTINSGSLIDQLMNGVVFYRGHRYAISTLDLGVLIDVGLLADTIFSNGFE